MDPRHLIDAFLRSGFAVTFLILVGVIVVGGMLLLAWLQGQNSKRLMEPLSRQLGFQMGQPTGYAFSPMPSCQGSRQAIPVWIGTVLIERGRQNSLFLQVVVGRAEGQAPVGPHSVGGPGVRDIPFDDIARQVQAMVGSATISEAASTFFGGGGTRIDLHPDAYVRTFLVSGMTSARWSRRVKATVEILVAYALSART